MHSLAVKEFDRSVTGVRRMELLGLLFHLEVRGGQIGQRLSLQSYDICLTHNDFFYFLSFNDYLALLFLLKSHFGGLNDLRE